MEIKLKNPKVTQKILAQALNFQKLTNEGKGEEKKWPALIT